MMRSILERLGLRSPAVEEVAVEEITIDPFDAVWPEIDTVPGFLAPNQERCLFDLVAALPEDALVLEVGSFLGRSTVSMAFACRNTARQVFAVDTFEGNAHDFVKGKNKIDWEGDSFFPLFWQHLRERGLDRHVVPLRATSHAIAKCWGKPLDMVYLDGSHQYADVVAEIDAFVPWIKPGGCVAMHDVIEGWPGVYRAWQEKLSGELVDQGQVGSLRYGYVRADS
ncbi:MAG: class I SAM-dependent methyltransferase [Gammaproteobacteria bacterium]